MSLCYEELELEQTSRGVKPRCKVSVAQYYSSAILTIWVIICLLGSADRASAQNTAKGIDEPVAGDEFKLALDDETSEQVDAWIEQLSSPDYAQRQQASNGLGLVGAPSFTKLRDAYRSTDELEVRLLIEDVVKDAYINWHARANKTGFLGITSQRLLLTDADDKRIAHGSVGLVISHVMTKTPAERSGLLNRDVIIALEDDTISDEGDKTFNKFAAEIQKFGPGRRVRLTILRGAEQLEISPILGKPNTTQVMDLANINERAKAALRRFPEWWATQFRQNEKHQESM